MKAYIFPGQGAQFSGMGKDLFDASRLAREYFEVANNILGFDISKIMFEGSPEELKETQVTQPAVFIHSVVLAKCLTDFKPKMAAGHSLGEFSALVACNSLSFEDGLSLVHKRALAMQKACKTNPSTMAAIIGLEEAIVETVCAEIEGIVIPANYNCPGQLVISGEKKAIEEACKILKEKGAKRTLPLPVSGAFHSPLMQPAKEELQQAIEQTPFQSPICPIYQNVSTTAVTDPEEIKANLIAQLTAPVKWSQSINQMIADGASSFTEVGPGRALQGMVKKINRDLDVFGACI